MEEIRELVALAVGCNEGEIVPHLGEVLDEKLKDTERKIAELSAFRDGLLYYRERAEELSRNVPVEHLRGHEFLWVPRGRDERRWRWRGTLALATAAGVPAAGSAAAPPAGSAIVPAASRPISGIQSGI